MDLTSSLSSATLTQDTLALDLAIQMQQLRLHGPQASRARVMGQPIFAMAAYAQAQARAMEIQAAVNTTPQHDGRPSNEPPMWRSLAARLYRYVAANWQSMFKKEEGEPGELTEFQQLTLDIDKQLMQRWREAGLVRTHQDNIVLQGGHHLDSRMVSTIDEPHRIMMRTFADGSADFLNNGLPQLPKRQATLDPTVLGRWFVLAHETAHLELADVAYTREGSPISPLLRSLASSAQLGLGEGARPVMHEMLADIYGAMMLVKAVGWTPEVQATLRDIVESRRATRQMFERQWTETLWPEDSDAVPLLRRLNVLSERPWLSWHEVRRFSMHNTDIALNEALKEAHTWADKTPEELRSDAKRLSEAGLEDMFSPTRLSRDGLPMGLLMLAAYLPEPIKVRDYLNHIQVAHRLGPKHHFSHGIPLEDPAVQSYLQAMDKVQEQEGRAQFWGLYEDQMVKAITLMPSGHAKALLDGVEFHMTQEFDRQRDLAFSLTRLMRDHNEYQPISDPQRKSLTWEILNLVHARTRSLVTTWSTAKNDIVGHEIKNWRAFYVLDPEHPNAHLATEGSQVSAPVVETPCLAGARFDVAGLQRLTSGLTSSPISDLESAPRRFKL